MNQNNKQKKGHVPSFLLNRSANLEEANLINIKPINSQQYKNIQNLSDKKHEKKSSNFLSIFQPNQRIRSRSTQGLLNKTNQDLAGSKSWQNKQDFNQITVDRKKDHSNTYVTSKQNKGLSDVLKKVFQNQQQTKLTYKLSFLDSKNNDKLNQKSDFGYIQKHEYNNQHYKNQIKIERTNLDKKNAAFDKLLKQGEDLISKYKRLQKQKEQLKSVLKNQKTNQNKLSSQVNQVQQKKNQQNHSIFQSPIQKVHSPVKKQQIKDQSQDYVKIQIRPPSNFKKEPKKQQKKFSKSPFKNKLEDNTNAKNTTIYDAVPLSFSVEIEKKEKNDKIFTIQDFYLGKSLGSGAFGDVYAARHKTTNWLFALKKIKKEKVKNMLTQFIHEIKIQTFLNHPNIVKLYSFFDDELHFYILMEFMQDGSLFSHLRKKKILTIEQTSQKLKEVCSGLSYMHDIRIIHRDLKPQNIVLSYNVAKICDFGWSAICKTLRITKCGTLDYICPQIIQGEGYDQSVDIWSVGVLTYQLLAGKPPFYNISRKQTMKKILDCNLEYPPTMPQIAVEFIKRILKKDTQDRRTIDEILKDKFLNVSYSQVQTNFRKLIGFQLLAVL